MSIEAPPSLLPAKRYCDVTGLPVGSPLLCRVQLTTFKAPYKEPKSGLRYNSVEMFELIRQMACRNL